MTTTHTAPNTHTENDTCVACGNFSLVNSHRHCSACLEVACGEGNGDRVGLPAVPDAKLDAAIQWAAEHIADDPMTIDHDAECMFCSLLDPRCGECGDQDAVDMPNDDEDHIIVQDIVLVCCEGFHTPALRWAALNV